MKLYSEKDIVKAQSAPFPKMTSGRGRIWESTDLIINNVPHTCFYDASWGRFGYFIYDGRCYKIPADYLDFTTKTEFFTNKKMVVTDETYDRDLANSKFTNTLYLWVQAKYHSNYNKKYDHETIWESVITSPFNSKSVEIMEMEDFINLMKNPTETEIKTMRAYFRVKKLSEEKFLKTVNDYYL